MDKLIKRLAKALNDLKSLPEVKKALEDKAVEPSRRKAFRDAKKDMPNQTDFLANQVTSEKGVSERGIEARRGDSRKTGVISHGYGRVTSPDKHMSNAKRMFRAIKNLQSAGVKPDLPKSENLDKADKAKGYGKTSYFSNMIAENKAMKQAPAAIKPKAPAANASLNNITSLPKLHDPQLSGKVDYKRKLAASEDKKAKAAPNLISPPVIASKVTLSGPMIMDSPVIDDGYRDKKNSHLDKARVDEGKDDAAKKEARRIRQGKPFMELPKPNPKDLVLSIKGARKK